MIALRGGRLCDPGAGWDGPADVYLAGGLVAAVLPAGAPAPDGCWQAVPCDGLLLVPGPVDALCRVSLQPDPWREDVRSAAAAAAAGGYTAVLAYTGSADPAQIAALAAMSGLPVRLHPVAALTRAGALADLGLLADAGAVAFSDWPEPPPDAGLMRRALEYAAWVGRPVVAHPEDPGLARGGVMHEGTVSFALGLRGVPAAAETVAVARDAALQRAFGGRLHFAALSCGDSLPLLSGATAAVTAHHLGLTEDAVRGYDAAAKLRPPLRTDEDRRALLAAALEGRLLLASGHDPHLPADKDREYDYAAAGASALETALPLALGLLGPQAFVHAASRLPAAVFGLAGGTLAPGRPADLAAFAPDEEWPVDPAGFASRGRASPLAGRVLRGRPAFTCVDGRLVRGRAAAAPAGVADPGATTA